MVNILVVEDDKKLNQIICRYLLDSAYNVDGCFSPREAYDYMYDKNYDLIISDIMMPDVDGFEFAETIRLENKNVPILFITARDDFESKQRGFKLGIDDYLIKPLNMQELLLRVEALLRRASITTKKRLEVGNLILDENEMRAIVNKIDVQVTIREFNILYKLLSYPNMIFSRNQLMDEFWGFDSDTGLRAVDVYITKLRNKFSDCTGFKIKTVHGLGYRAEIL